MRALVVGTGRCGTGWAADALRTYGLRVGHQRVVRHAHVLGRERFDAEIARGLDVEVSYEATPLLWLDYRCRHQFAALGVERTVLLVRHPLLVVRSWLRRCDFGEDLSTRFADLGDSILSATPEVFDAPPGAPRAARFWRTWNQRALDAIREREGVRRVLRIEGLSPEELVAACGFEEELFGGAGEPPPGTRDATDPLYDVEPVTWDDLGVEAKPVGYLALELGYGDIPE